MRTLTLNPKTLLGTLMGTPANSPKTLPQPTLLWTAPWRGAQVESYQGLGFSAWGVGAKNLRISGLMVWGETYPFVGKSIAIALVQCWLLALG